MLELYRNTVKVGLNSDVVVNLKIVEEARVSSYGGFM